MVVGFLDDVCFTKHFCSILKKCKLLYNVIIINLTLGMQGLNMMFSNGGRISIYMSQIIYVGYNN